MATPRPKQFRAARGFISRGKSYRAGDPVTDRRTLARLIPHGDKFVVWKTTPAVDTANTKPAESGRTEK